MENISTAGYTERGFGLYPAQRFALPTPPSSVATHRVLQCDVVFGSPKEDCRGTGICRIATSYKSPNPSVKRACRYAPALMSSSPDGKQVTILFRRSDLCAHLTRHYFFQKACLEINHSCALPTSIVSRLGLRGDSIPVGKHIISSGGGYYRIDFNLYQTL